MSNCFLLFARYLEFLILIDYEDLLFVGALSQIRVKDVAGTQM
jgi:hypothetical protein